MVPAHALWLLLSGCVTPTPPEPIPTQPACPPGTVRIEAPEAAEVRDRIIAWSPSFWERPTDQLAPPGLCRVEEGSPGSPGLNSVAIIVDDGFESPLFPGVLARELCHLIDGRPKDISDPVMRGLCLHFSERYSRAHDHAWPEAFLEDSPEGDRRGYELIAALEQPIGWEKVSTMPLWRDTGGSIDLDKWTATLDADDQRLVKPMREAYGFADTPAQ